MTPDQLDLRGGMVMHWSLEGLRPDLDLSAQEDELKEDLAQVEFSETGRVLDVGWYGGQRGKFVVAVVEAQDWEHPVFRQSTTAIGDLRKLIELAAAVACERA
jgi:hypothetical protein